MYARRRGTPSMCSEVSLGSWTVFGLLDNVDESSITLAKTVLAEA
jgi:hypothetical protein